MRLNPASNCVLSIARANSAILLAVILAAASVSIADDRYPEGFEIEQIDLMRIVPDGGTVTVENRFGNVTCRFGGYEHEARLFGAIQHFDDEGPRLEIRSIVSKSGVVYRVGYRENGSFVQVKNPEQLKRADLGVQVPLGHPVFIITDDGSIGSKNIQSPLRAQSTSGNITIKLNKGPVDAATQSGRIVALFQRGQARRLQTLSSKSGEIQLHIPEDADFDISMSTNGLISTDYSMTLDYSPQRSPKKIGVATVGNGGVDIEATSETGQIKLIRRLGKPKQPQPYDPGVVTGGNS